MTIRLEEGAGERIAGKHDSASTTIHGSAKRGPEGVDGGVGTPHLLDILAAVAGTADDLALIHGVLGEQVRSAAGSIARTDAEVAASFARLDRASS
jgi:hypothetical protein